MKVVKLVLGLCLFQATIFAMEPESHQTALSDHSLHHNYLTCYQKGDLPILLTAPHGGQAAVPNVPIRSGKNPQTGQKIKQFWRAADDGTLEIVRQVSDNIYQLIGARPYIVIADFSRKYIDANRPAGLRAYENPNAQPYYDFYHSRIREYIQEIKQRFGAHAILVDVHGQGVDGSTVYRGTCDHLTVKKLIARDGNDAFTGPLSILGVLAQKGNTIYPKNNDQESDEDSNFSGGYTVQAYGSHNQNGIDALQLENGWELRRDGRAKFSKDLADALVQFYGAYLIQ